MIRKAKIPLLISLTVILIFFTLNLILGFSNIEARSLLYSALLSTLNFILFILCLRISEQKSNKTFLLITMGGIGVRLILVLTAVFISIKFLNVDTLAFIFGLFISYFFHLIYEISIASRGFGK
jgi:hypothetical protein